MFDEVGKLAWKAQLDVYGVAHVEEGATSDCPWRSAGQYADDETGLYYNRFRYYDPARGNYISQDPIRLDGGAELYGFVRDPLSWIDPLGLSGCGSPKDDAAERLARYDGPKPKYHVNEAHVPGPKFNREKTPLPKDAEEVFRNAVPDSVTAPRNWFGLNSEGKIYRFSGASNGIAHFSGIEGVGDGIRNITDYALKRMQR